MLLCWGWVEPGAGCEVVRWGRCPWVGEAEGRTRGRPGGGKVGEHRQGVRDRHMGGVQFYYITVM